MLQIVASLGEHEDIGLSAARLTNGYAISIPTLRRYISEARNMGAKIESRKIDGRSYYIIENWSAVQNIVERWIQLETDRSFTA